MSAVFKLGPFGLQSVTIGVNEIASCIAIGKAVGSVFSRREDAKVFDALENVIGVSRLPPWLRDVNFERHITLHGSDFRSIKTNLVMSEVNVDRLQGLATLFVICLRFVEPKQSISRLLNEFLAGRLGTVIGESEYVVDGVFSQSVKPLLGTFVEACISSDADSIQAGDARNWMIKLTEVLQNGWHGATIPERRLKATQAFLKSLFRADGESYQTTSGASGNTTDLGNVAASIHDTKHITTAYLALTAAANGADVVLQCIDQQGTYFLPSNRTSTKSSLLVRLWLSQPPQSILSVFSDLPIALDGMASSQGTADDVIIYGGAQEVSFWCGRRLNVTGEYSMKSCNETTQALWHVGTELVKQCAWQLRVLEETPMTQVFLNLDLDVSKLGTNVDVEAVSLATALVHLDPDLEYIAGAIASAVHKVYHLSDYSKLLGIPRGEKVMRGSMHLVIIGLVTSLLHQITRFPDGSQSHYALSLEDATRTSGSFWSLLKNARRLGVDVPQCLSAACALWGGTAAANVPVGGHALGIVTPHCSLVLDSLRDPIAATRQGLDGPWILGCRGSMPMLPRDKSTGWVQSGRNTARSSGLISKILRRSHSSPKRETLGEISFTFQHTVNDATKGLLCCWVGGHLVYEVDPFQCFVNLLGRPIGLMRKTERDYTLETTLAGNELHWIPPTELLKIGHFGTQGSDFAVFLDAGQDIPLAVLAAGLCESTQALIHRGPPETLKLETRKFMTPNDFVICLDV